MADGKMVRDRLRIRTLPCIFCGTNDDLTEEHVFPACLGGTLVVPNGSCRKCNGECGKFENRVSEATRTARHVFDIANRRGEVPDARVKIEIRGNGLDGVVANGRITPENELTIYDLVTETVSPDGKKMREGFFLTNESAKRFIERSGHRGEKTTELEFPKDFELLPNSQQTVEFIVSDDMLRTVAKIAFASLAYRYGTDYACTARFTQLRDSILGRIKEKVPVVIFANEAFIDDCERTPQQHCVRVCLSAGQNRGWAFVTVFGGLTYIVELTQNLEERETKKFSLFFDTSKGAEFHPVVLYDEWQLVEKFFSKDTAVGQLDSLDRQWYSVVESYCSKNGMELSRIELTVVTQAASDDEKEAEPP